jgi:hypothetical protein
LKEIDEVIGINFKTLANRVLDK